MTVKISHTAQVQDLIKEAAGFNNEQGSPRLKQLMHRLISDVFKTIEDLEVTEDEFWLAVDRLNKVGAHTEFGLLLPGLSMEHFMDLLQDARDEQVGLTGGTPRTIEGPLYVANAPLSEGFARMDDASEDDVATPLFISGTVTNTEGKPVAGAIVDLWHANTNGTYSYFDQSQSAFNLRRRIKTDAQGNYRARSIIPSGYGVDPQGPTQECLSALGRHGQRPAHIHVFVSAPEHRHLTSQINLDGDQYLWDDFAYATRDGLVGEARLVNDAEASKAHGLDGRQFAELAFDFVLQPAATPDDELRSQRPRVGQ
ncbi:catechol 1,2-dioxygenase [Pseudomonas sp. SZMC_28357]|uniref:catechol 1,2-dioxygenase n=1 Tax=Pseudomonas sp. SZMC_28357 TaxID=3074380 RepID=UPI002871289F|nr:catechol 1,2-dioxygenase [Pseudomonas sp. SZMC_28357]MDR9752499.1 catechol 1,2-dioxygenase [Pseudomonas sp. SZMC_28357]